MKPRYPVMAALLAATLAAPMLLGSAFANQISSQPRPATPKSSPAVKPGTAGSSCVDKAKAENNAINLIACDLKGVAKAKDDISARFYDYLFAANTKGESYVDENLKKDAASEKTRKVLKDAVAAWVKAGIDGKATSGGKKVSVEDVATLYFVIGPGDKIPEWAASQGLGKDTLKFRPDWAARMEEALADYVKTKVAGSEVVARTDGFLTDAAARAQVILGAQESKDQIRISIGANETTASLPPVIAAPVTSVPGVPPIGAEAGIDDLYRNGGLSAKVYSPDDVKEGVDAKYKGHRELSVKYYSSIDANGNMVNRLGVIDITANDPSNPSAVHFIDLTATADSFTLKDGGRPYKYTMTMDENGVKTISIARDGAAGGGVLSTTVQSLEAARARQVKSAGTVTIDGKVCYVGCQGGENGSLLYYPKADVDAFLADPRRGPLYPVARSDIYGVGPDGNSGPVSSKPRLQVAKNGPFEDAKWHNERNPSTGLWEIKPGEGDKPKPKPDPAAPAPQTPGQPGQPPAQTPGTPPAGAPCQPGSQPRAITNGDTAIDVAVKLALAACWQDEPTNAQLSEVKDKVHIMTASGENLKHEKVTFYYILFAPSLGVKGNQFMFDSVKVRGYGGKYLVAELSDPQSRYYTPEQFAAWLNEPTAPTSGINKGGQMLDTRSLDIMVDIFAGKLPPGAMDTIADRVKAHVPGGSYQLASVDKLINVCERKGDSCPSGAPVWQVWPDDKDVRVAGDNKGVEQLKGPGVAMAVASNMPSDPFPKTFELAPGNSLTLDVKQADIGWYVGTEEVTDKDNKTKKVKAWYAMVAYLGKGSGADGKPELMRTAAFPVFNDGERGTLPSGLQIKGLAKQYMPDGARFMEFYGSTQKRGAIGAYRSATPNADCKNITANGAPNEETDPAKNSAPNAAGPILWWGMKYEEALKASACGKL